MLGCSSGMTAIYRLSRSFLSNFRFLSHTWAPIYTNSSGLVTRLPVTDLAILVSNFSQSSSIFLSIFSSLSVLGLATETDRYSSLSKSFSNFSFFGTSLTFLMKFLTLLFLIKVRSVKNSKSSGCVWSFWRNVARSTASNTVSLSQIALHV